MDFNLSEEQKMLAEAARRFVGDTYQLEQRRKLAKSPDGFSRAHWQQFAELGWLMLNIPEAHGGLGANIIETLVLAEQFGRGMVLEPFTINAVLCPYLLEHGDADALRTALLPRLASGEVMMALAHGEAGAARGCVAAKAEPAGAGYRLNAVKQLVYGGPSADHFIVSAMLPDHDGYNLFVVDRDAPGISMDAYALVDGTRAADLRLKNVALPASALLAGSDTAGPLLEEALDRTHLVLSALAVGAMEANLQGTNEYIKTRIQFGQPIGRFQALQHMMAEAFVGAQAARSALYRGLAFIDESPAERAQAISACRLTISRAGRRVGETCIQLHGGYGITDEFAVSHYYRYLLVLEKMFGDESFHAERFAALAYGQPSAAAVDA